jgi:hypothetical protein
MTESLNSLAPELQNLKILPNEGKQTGENCLQVLGALCSGYLAMKNFDSTLPVDETVGNNGEIIFIQPTIYNSKSEGSEIDPSECNQLVSYLETKMTELTALAETMMAMTVSLTKIVEAVAKSGNFDFDIVKTFLKEFVILLDIMFKIDVANELPESWNFFKEITMLQNQIFDIYMEAETYNHAKDLIMTLLNNTEFQKEFLQRCIDESVGFEDVMTEVGAAISSMLSLQEDFILKLIDRLHKSKTDEGTLKWVAV